MQKRNSCENEEHKQIVFKKANEGKERKRVQKQKRNRENEKEEEAEKNERNDEREKNSYRQSILCRNNNLKNTY